MCLFVLLALFCLWFYLFVCVCCLWFVLARTVSLLSQDIMPDQYSPERGALYQKSRGAASENGPDKTGRVCNKQLYMG